MFCRPPAVHACWLLAFSFTLPSAVGGQQIFGPPRAHQAVRGHLFDLETMTTISTGAITLISGSERLRTTITDDDGYFFLPIAEPGEYQLEARRMGYATTVSQPIQVTRADTLTVRFGVQVRAVLLDPLPRGDDAYNALVWGILHRACPRPLVLAPTLARITILGRSGCGLGLTLTS